jgi:hypothetical protein
MQSTTTTLSGSRTDESPVRHGDVKRSFTLDVFRAVPCFSTSRAHDNANEARRHTSVEDLESDVDESRRSDIPTRTTRGTLRKRHETIDDLQRRNVVEDPRVFEVVPTEVAMTTPRSDQLEPGARFAK